MSRRHDDSIRQRIDDREARDEATRGPVHLEGSERRACRTVKVGDTYPAGVNVFFGVEEYAISGPETEGAAAVETATGIRYFAYNLGHGHPPEGTKVTVAGVPHRWVFSYNG